MDRLDPLALDRDLRRTAERWRAWRRALRRGEGFERDPFAITRAAVGLTTFRRIADELGNADPLAGPLRRWVHRLAEQRINADAIATVERLRRVDTHPLDEPVEGHFTLAAMGRRALTDRDRRDAWLEQSIERAEPLTHAVMRLWERRREVAERMGVGDLDAMESPSPDLAATARAWLLRTRDVARDLGATDPVRTLDLALATGADRGWPGRLTLRNVAEWLNEGHLLQGLPLDPGELPEPIGGSSFLRAVARLGAAFVDASAPAHQPFVIAHDPHGLRRRRTGALFARLLLSPDFARRRLALDRSQIPEHLRALAASLWIESRIAAVRVLLRHAALDGSPALSECYQELSSEALGRPFPPRALGLILRVPDDAPARFAGLLLSACDGEALVNEHNEDWYRNPRAAEQLRAEAAISPAVTASVEEIDHGAAMLEAELVACLD